MSSPLPPRTGPDGPAEDGPRAGSAIDGAPVDERRLDHRDGTGQYPLDQHGRDGDGRDHDGLERGTDPNAPVAAGVGSREVRQVQQERFGGIKVGSAFFGWLTATGMAVILLALLAAAGVAFGIADDATAALDSAGQPTGQAQTVGLAGGIALLVVLLLAYYCGGYVAGRMARFNGLRQGLAVWIWGVVIVLVVAAVAAIAGSQYDVLAQLNLPRLPVNEGQVTTVGAIVIGAALLAALVGALLGGLAGMRFHRKVDRAIDDTAVVRS